MSANTAIEWVHWPGTVPRTWNPVRGCTPLKWRAPSTVFVNSMSDLFHEALPDEAIDRIFAAMAEAKKHTFLILTKRPARMLKYFLSIDERAVPVWDLGSLPNVFLGVSVEDQATADERIPLLLGTPAAKLFVSYEPALGPVDFEEWLREGVPTDEDIQSERGVRYIRHGTPRIDWIIAGGESGPKARPAHPGWFRSTRDQCVAAGVPFFFKQWGEWAPRSHGFRAGRKLDWGTIDATGKFWPTTTPWNGHDDDGFGNEAVMIRAGKKAAGRLLDGRTWGELPK